MSTRGALDGMRSPSSWFVTIATILVAVATISHGRDWTYRVFQRLHSQSSYVETAQSSAGPRGKRLTLRRGSLFAILAGAVAAERDGRARCDEVVEHEHLHDRKRLR